MKYTLHSAQLKAPPQGKETQVHSGPQAEPKHLLPQPGHVGCGKHILAKQPISSALFYITPEHALELQPQAELQQQFTDSIQRHTCFKPRRRWQVLASLAESMACLSTFVFQGQGEKNKTGKSASSYTASIK